MTVPPQFANYKCADYFASDRYTHGVWDDKSQLWVIVSADEVIEHPELELLVVGRPGCDGIEFGYRKGLDGLWAYYPIEQVFELVAPTVRNLVEDWFSGALTV